jgi:uncharacterized protein (TIGR03435 family)
MRFAIAVSMAVCLSGSGAAPLMALQPAPDDDLRFEVASIRRHTDATGGRAGIEDNPSLVRIENLPVRALIRIAYGVMDGQIEPGRLDASPWDIVAKPPAGYESRHLPVLLRNLLEDRFGLRVHRETRNVAAFALRQAPSGARLTVSTRKPGFLTGRAGLISGTGRTIADIVPIIADAVSAPVVDETGLTGRYDIKLEWTPPQPAGAPAADEPYVSISTALRDQLGLRLVSRVMPVDALIIDAVEREPTEN